MLDPPNVTYNNTHLTILFHKCVLDNNHLISNKHEWNDCFIKKNQEMLLDLADFTLQEQPQDNSMITIFRSWLIIIP